MTKASRTRALIALNLSAFSWNVGLGAAVPVIPLLSYQLKPNLALAGIVTSMGGLGRVLVSYISGPMMDRFGRKTVSLIGVTIRMIFSFMEGVAASQTYYHLAFYRFMSGVGTAIWGVGLSTITADISTRRDRGSISGGRMGLAGLGSVLGPLFGGWAWGVTKDIRVPFFINGFSKMACLLLFLFVMRETGGAPQKRGAARARRREPQQQDTEPKRGSPWGKRLVVALLTSGFAFVIYSMFASALFREGINNVILPLYVRQVLKLSQAQLGLIISAIGLGGLVISFPAGRIVDRWGPHTVIIPGVLLLLGPMLLMAQNISAGIPLVLATILGVGLGLLAVGIAAFSIDIAPAGARGSFFGKTQAAGNLATLVGPLVLGQFTDSFGYAAVFLLHAVLFAVMLPMSLMVMRRVAQEEKATPPVA